MNICCFIGRLAADPELRSTNSGISVCTFRIGVSRRFKDADGQTPTDWINIVAWRQLGELCAKYLAKGRKVAISGSLQSRNYEDKQGNKRVAYEVVANDVEFLTPKEKRGGSEKSSDFAGFSEIEAGELPF